MKKDFINFLNYIRHSVKYKLHVCLLWFLLFFPYISLSASPIVNNENDTAIWFVNIYPGSVIYELEGHSALRIITPQNDIAVHYGLFDFNSPNFVMRFVKGETDYMVGAQSWNSFIQEYKHNGRRIVAHRLNMTDEQKKDLLKRLEENLRPENREYRYNYVLDNCATRPLRMVELALGDTIILPEPSPTVGGDTFRDIMRRYHANYPWYQFGIDLALGRGIDREISVREKAFAPVVLDDQIRKAVIGDRGQLLVLESVVLNDTPEFGAVLQSTPWFLTPLFVCWIVALLGSAYAIWLVIRKDRYPRILTSVTMAINGLVGLLVTFLVCFSAHEATSPNANILWLNPLCFIPAISLWIKNAKKLNKWCFLINFVLLFSLLILWMVHYQSPNPAFVPLVFADMLLSALYLYKYKFIRERA